MIGGAARLLAHQPGEHLFCFHGIGSNAILQLPEFSRGSMVVSKSALPIHSPRTLETFQPAKPRYPLRPLRCAEVQR